MLHQSDQDSSSRCFAFPGNLCCLYCLSGCVSQMIWKSVVSSQTRVGSIETTGRVSQSLQVLDLDLLLRNVELNGGHVDIFVDKFIANL